MKRQIVLAALLAGSALHPGAALAMQAAETETADAVSTDDILVVTARKREEKLLEAPVAISVVSGQQLETVGADRISDMAARLPNVASLDQPAGISNFSFSPFIRGISTGARTIGFDSGFGIFINGAYAGRNEAANKFLPDVERVEFLPGPQATLFGKNTTIGVLNIVTRKPGNTWEGDVSADFGNNGHREYVARARGPLSDVFGISLGVGRREYDGYYKNVVPASRQIFDVEGVNGRVGPKFESNGGSVELTARLDRTSIDLLVDYTKSMRDNDIYLGRVEGFDALPLDVRESNSMPSQSNKDYGGILSIVQAFDAGDLTLVTAHRNFDNDVAFDGDAYAFPLQEGPEWSTRQVLTSQEVRFGGKAGGLSYLVGGYWQQQTSKSARIGDFMGLAQVLVAGEIKSRTLSAFTNLDYRFNDMWGVEVGLRWEDEQKKLVRFTQSGGAALGLIDVDQAPLKRGVQHLSYTAALSFAPAQDLNAHFRYSKGYKSGGYNIDFVTAPFLTPIAFDDESADNYELGLKYQPSPRVFLSAVYYRTDYHDLQQSEYVVVSGQTLPVITTKNSGEARTEGIELSASYQGERLNLNASLGTAKARYTKWLRQTQTGFSDESGKRLPAPDFTFNIMGDYRIPIGNSALHLIAEFIHRSKAPQAVTMPTGLIDPGDPTSPLRPSYHVDAVSVLNFRTRLEINDALSVTGWVRNVLNDRAVVLRQPNDAEGLFELFGLLPASSIRTQVLGEHQAPRHYGVTLQYRF